MYYSENLRNKAPLNHILPDIHFKPKRKDKEVSYTQSRS